MKSKVIPKLLLIAPSSKNLKDIIKKIFLICFLATFITIYGLWFARITSPNRYYYIVSSDLRAFYTAGLIGVNEPSKLYDLNSQLKWQKTFIPELQNIQDLNPFRNPPFLALLFAPLILLPFEQAYFLFFGGNLILFFLIIYLVFILLPKTSGLDKLLIFLMTLTFVPIFYVFSLTQTSFFLLISLLLGRLLFEKKRYFQAGIALSLLTVKFQYLPLLILFLLVKKQGKILIGLFAGIIVFLLLSLLTVGRQGMAEYSQFILNNLNRLDMLTIHPRFMVNLQSLFLNFLNTDLSSSVRPIWLISVIFLSAFFLYWCRRLKTNRDFDIQWGLLVIVLLLTSPYANIQDLSLVIVSAVSITRWARGKGKAILRNIFGIIVGGYLLGNAITADIILNYVYIYVIFLIFVFLYLIILSLKNPV